MFSIAASAYVRLLATRQRPDSTRTRLAVPHRPPMPLQGWPTSVQITVHCCRSQESYDFLNQRAITTLTATLHFKGSSQQDSSPPPPGLAEPEASPLPCGALCSQLVDEPIG